MAWNLVLVAALAYGANAIRTSFAVSELRDLTTRDALLQDKYLRLSRFEYPAAVDVDPSLLYPAYNLSVPIDHFHNDSLYEPHVSHSKDSLVVSTSLCESRPVSCLHKTL